MENQPIPQLILGEPLEEQAWHLQLKDKRLSGKRPIDKMSIAQVLQMYEERKFLCDTCGKELLVGRNEFSLIDHIVHLINPLILWGCEDCIISDIKNGRVIAATSDNLKSLIFYEIVIMSQEGEITCVRQSNGVITHVGIGGWLQPVQTVVYWVQNGVTIFTDRYGRRVQVFARQHPYNKRWFLTTDPDDIRENNLDFLPNCA